MALYRDLISAVAEAEGLSEMAVTGIGQYLRDAGLISKFGRGKAAAHMTVEDAVNLLIAVNATDLAKNAPQAVAEHIHLIKTPMSENKRKDDVSKYVTSDGNDFGMAMRFILCALMPTGDIRSDFDSLLNDTDTLVEVGFARPGPEAYIKIAEEGPSNPGDPFGGPGHRDRAFAYYRGRAKPWLQHRGRKELRIIDHTVLRAVAAILI